MPKVAGIYKITSPSGKVYIGQSWDIPNRWLKYHRSGCKTQRKLQHSFDKHGVNRHTFEIVYYLPQDPPNNTQYNLDIWEQFLMDDYRTRPTQLLNIREGGSRGRISRETGQRISAAKKGKSPSEETKRKISETLKRYIVPPEVRAKMVATRMARPKTDREIAGQAIISSKLRGREITQEWRAKISETLKRRNATNRSAEGGGRLFE